VRLFGVRVESLQSRSGGVAVTLDRDEKPAAQTSNAPATPIPSAPIPSAPAAPAHPARAASDEDYVSEDDEKVENSTFIGLRAIEKIIGGTVIDERPLHQP